MVIKFSLDIDTNNFVVLVGVFVGQSGQVGLGGHVEFGVQVGFGGQVGFGSKGGFIGGT